MKDPGPVAVLPDIFVSEQDTGLLNYISSLRASVRARVATEQQRGLSLSEIVVQVREMVRLKEEEPRQPKPFAAHALRSISRQAVGWCVEAYRPLLFTRPIDLSERMRNDGLPVNSHIPASGSSGDGLPAKSPTYRGLP
jgi:hypothetical protein